jgi:hypothetical protein
MRTKRRDREHVSFQDLVLGGNEKGIHITGSLSRVNSTRPRILKRGRTFPPVFIVSMNARIMKQGV